MKPWSLIAPRPLSCEHLAASDVFLTDLENRCSVYVEPIVWTNLDRHHNNIMMTCVEINATYLCIDIEYLKVKPIGICKRSDSR